jgi:hypothetical protein
LRNPEPFDPQAIRRYSVIHVYYEYPWQRGEEKYFVVLRQAREVQGDCCWCIKATSRVPRYEADERLLNSVVLYERNTIPFFTERTVIDPASFIQMWHSHLKNEADRGRYRIAGRMPEDFHAKLVAAIKQPFLLEPKTAKQILRCIGEEQ